MTRKEKIDMHKGFRKDFVVALEYDTFITYYLFRNFSKQDIISHFADSGFGEAVDSVKFIEPTKSNMGEGVYILVTHTKDMDEGE